MGRTAGWIPRRVDFRYDSWTLIPQQRSEVRWHRHAFDLFGSVTVLCTVEYIRSNEPKHLFLTSATLAIAILTKGVAAGIFVFVLIPVVLYHLKNSSIGRPVSSRSWIRRSRPFVLVWFVHGDLFVQEFVLKQVVSRVEEGSKFSYFRALVTNERICFPWVFVVPLAILNALRRWKR